MKKLILLPYASLQSHRIEGFEWHPDFQTISLKSRDFLCLCHSLSNIWTVAPNSVFSVARFVLRLQFSQVEISLQVLQHSQAGVLNSFQFPSKQAIVRTPCTCYISNRTTSSIPTSRLRWYLTSLWTIRIWRDLIWPVLILTTFSPNRICSYRCLASKSLLKMV